MHAYSVVKFCWILCDSMDCSLTGSSVHGIFPGNNTGVGCHFLLQCMKVKEEREKVGLKLNLQKTKIMASGPITSWQIDGETMETVTDFIFLGSKISVDDCSHEIKRCLILGRKAVTNLDSILKTETTICQQRTI